VAIAVRAALRVLPLVGVEKISPAKAETIVLPVFRASAIARVAAAYPTRAIGPAARAAIAAAYAAAADDDDVAAAAARAAAAAARATRISSSPSSAARAAASAAASAARATRDSDAVTSDLSTLDDGGSTPEQLARSKLWPTGISDMPPEVSEAWSSMSAQLRALGSHWHVWIDWYDEVLMGSPPAPRRSEAWEMAFTDVERPLPWPGFADAVNTEIARRLQSVAAQSSQVAIARGTKDYNWRRATLEDLAEIASPQPSITTDGRLDAGPNPTYDISSVDDDLPTLPIRQLRLISIVLGDLPANAPKHLGMCLRSYDDELRARGVQPILGLLKDMADVIAAAVAAPRAEDEWLEPGMRQALNRFAENHALFLQHFPLDPKREDIFARIPVDEGKAAGKTLTEPFESVAKTSAEAHQAGLTTDGFVAVIDKMTELARVLATQPTALPLPEASIVRKVGAISPEVRVDPADRPPLTVKKRSVLSALGFFERAFNLAGSSATLGATEQGAQIISALRDAIASLWNLIS
jgi:hypothetical protein